MKLGAFLREASEKIPSSEVIWLLGSLLQKNHGELLLAREQILDSSQLLRLEEWIGRRLRGEPLQYITGATSFWGREFLVEKGVLIPRPETEVLVALALREIDRLRARKVFDVGVGTGCIGITLLCERPKLRLVGSDINSKAVALAKKNAKSLGVARRTRFFKEAFLAPVRKFPPDIVVANPPYLNEEGDELTQEVKDWEPENALFSKDAGTWHAEQIFKECLEIRPRALVLELSPKVAVLLEKKWQKEKKVKVIHRESDLAGRSRFLLVEFDNG